jgi:hypothetical protein
LRFSAEARTGAFRLVPARTAGTMPMPPVHPWSALALVPGFERSDMPRRYGPRIRCREFDGEWRVLNAAKAIWLNQLKLHMRFN